jgi:hypothetical protein
VGGLGTGTLNQQNVVTLVPTLNQATTGQCVSSTNYWDIGMRGDAGPTNHAGVTLAPLYSVMTSTAGYDASNTTGSPNFVRLYCNGARVPPENGGLGYNVPPGIADATVPNPIFNLTPAATVDEGNNWINIAWGPLSLSNPSTVATPGTTATPLGNYTTAAGSSAINKVPSSAPTYPPAPALDFFGTARKTNNAVDAGAVEFAAGGGGGGGGGNMGASLTPAIADFGTVTRGTTTAGPVQVFVLTNTGDVPLTGVTQGVLGDASALDFFVVPLFSTCGPAANGQLLGQTTLAVAPALGSSCIVTVQFRPRAAPAPTGLKAATISVTNASGTQTSTLTGTAN